MTAFLLALSLLLNIIALLAFTLLFLRQNKLMETEKKQEKMFNEMEEVISTYLVQMKEENDDFINRVSQLKINALRLKDESKEKLAKTQENMEESEKPNRLAKASAYQAVRAYKKNTQPDSQADEKMELKAESDSGSVNEASALKVEKQRESEGQKHHAPSLLDNVLLLRKQGLTEDEIAKTLGKGRTEVALMLKFRQNQQE
ncbi:hypothetical protein GCM10009865_23380 [Aeromicrobium ponti]|uniref:Coupling factor for flagellin transcription and translation n=1 Tax=Cytobacillus oceanisediminis TaxID=665099 RepID=A0A562JW14_9BACI|nr:hypothetical protein [Cytobacillus oceanisediminis]TWH87382.1 hypothetical protein IQ19_02332 [Cytobacillus oceanisediminis]